MKWRLRTAGLLLLVALGAAARLPEWVRDLESGHRLGEVFFEAVSLPGGPLLARRPPGETRAALSALIAAEPTRADLHSLRGREAERQLDFVAAEVDWKRQAELGEDRAAGTLALADFYQRRARPRDEAKALLAVAELPAADTETPHTQQKSWQAFERILKLAAANLFEPDTVTDYFRAWLDRYPSRQELYNRLADHLLDQNDFAAVERFVDEYQAAFPTDTFSTVRFRARLAEARGDAEDGIAVYEEGFDPVWPAGLIGVYFDALGEAGLLRAKLDEHRTRLAGDAHDLDSSGWVFHYQQRQRNAAGAREVVDGYRLTKEQGGDRWNERELRVLAELSRRRNDPVEAARYFYALHTLDSAGDAAKEDALGGIINLLLTYPDQPIARGSGDLSLYRDIATIDPHPGFLNGILSLLFNEQGIEWRFRNQEQTAQAYFHRAAAGDLLTLFDSKFPASDKRAGMHARLHEVYALYGDNEAVLLTGDVFLSEFPDAFQRMDVTLRMADAHARLSQTDQEFALYEQLLEELAERADRRPLGRDSIPNQDYRFDRGRRYQPPRTRSPRYARVLELYTARLVALERIPAALDVFRREIDRNPDDPGLYEKFAVFLGSVNYADPVENVYRQAIARFNERGWYEKLARWYLRLRRNSDFSQLSNDVVDAFAGAELEAYFAQVVGGSIDAKVYLQLNLYAHRRFPHNLTFVRNLLAAYRNRLTRDMSSWQDLLRRYWFHAPDLTNQYFEFLSRTGRLQPTLRSLEGQLGNDATNGQWNRVARENGPAARLLAEARLWQCHYEQAAPILLASISEAPGEFELCQRAATVHRSIAYEDPIALDIAAALGENLANAQPGDRGRLAWVGDALADRARYDASGRLWDRMAEVEPGLAGSYLDAATVYWDYYLFDDALRLLELGRGALGDPALFAYQAGAIEEGRRRPNSAIKEYLQGALAAQTDYQAYGRLVTLARREEFAAAIDQTTARLTAGAAPKLSAVKLRVDVLRALDRGPEISDFLVQLAEDSESFELLDEIENLARSNNSTGALTAVMLRRIDLARDPVDHTRLRLALMRHYEARGRLEDAQAVIESVYAEQPKILGVARAAVDYYLRRENFSRAIALLLASADASYPRLSEHFRIEAAERSLRAQVFAGARRIVDPLIADKPFDGRLIQIYADSFAGEADYDELRDFYQEKLDAIADAGLPATEKRATVARLRRGMIPALTALEDTTAAIDQYIELVNAYPEDAALITEAATYALVHEQTERIAAFYEKTTIDSPRDVRFHVMLARLLRKFEQFDQAIEAYERALQVRPDRIDLWQSKLEVETLLMRFDAALASAGKLYELTYEDPDWMERQAELHARKGDRAASMDALDRAFIAGRPENPEKYLAAAERAEELLYLDAARAWIQQGFDAAGSGIFDSYRHQRLIGSYARIMSRVRRHEAAFSKLENSSRGKTDGPAMELFRGGLEQMASAVKLYYTPEEKVEFALFLERERSRFGADAFEEYLMPVARNAGLVELEVRWLVERMAAHPAVGRAEEFKSRLVELQRSRLRFAELGRQLATYWQLIQRGSGRDYVLRDALAAFRDAGDVDAELEISTGLYSRGWISADDRERYFEILLDREPARLVELSGASYNPINYLVARGRFDLAQRAIERRKGRESALWADTYTGLAGHFLGASEAVPAFRAALGPRTVGGQLDAAGDRTSALVGDQWFPHATSFGDYFSLAGSPESAGFLPALIEAHPARPAGYAQLGDLLREANRDDEAVNEYARALELNESDVSVLLSLAEIESGRGNVEAARTRWEQVFALLTSRARAGSMSEEQRRKMLEMLATLGASDQGARFSEPALNLLRAYFRGFGSYRADETALAFLDNGLATFQQIADAASEANAPQNILRNLADGREVSTDNKLIAERAAFELAVKIHADADAENYSARQAYIDGAVRLVRRLLDEDLVGEAAGVYGDLPEPLRETLKAQQRSTVIELLTLTEGARQAIESSIKTEDVAAAADRLRARGREGEADALLEAYYGGRVARQVAGEADFVGLADRLLSRNDDVEALELIQRLTRLESLESYSGFRVAGRLLSWHGRHDEAREFWAAYVHATPWDLVARLELERGSIAAGGSMRVELSNLAHNPAAAYDLRVNAVVAAGGVWGDARQLPSQELSALAGPPPSGRVALQGAYAANVRAAETADDVAAKVRLLRQAFGARPEAANLEIRTDLFHAARELGDHRLAVLVAEPWTDDHTSTIRLQRSDSVFAADADERELDDWTVQRFVSTLALDDSARAQLAVEIADSAESTGHLRAAQHLYALARAVDSEADGFALADAAYNRVRAVRERNAENANRRLRVHKGLDQAHLVRRVVQ